MKFVCDIDSTVCLTMPLVLSSFARAWGKSLPVPTTWDARDSWPDLRPEEIAWLDGAYVSSFTAGAAQPILGAVESVSLARELGFDVIFRSSRPAEQTDLTIRWLEYHGFLAPRDVTFWTVICGRGSKVGALSEYPGERLLFLDDSPKDLRAIAEFANDAQRGTPFFAEGSAPIVPNPEPFTARVTLCCYEQPWNAFLLPEGTHRIANHEAFQAFLAQYAGREERAA